MISASRRTSLLASGLAIVCLGAVALAAGGAPPLLRIAVTTLAFALAPGAAAIGLIAPARRFDLALTLALSPFVLGALMTATMLAGFSAGVAAILSALICAGALGYIAWRDRALTDAAPAIDPATDRDRIGKGAWLTVLLLTACVALPLSQSNRVRTSVHGMLHASMLYSAIDRGVPPENPFFAGETLRYYWTWHAGIAAVCCLGDVDPTIAFAVSNVVALIAFLALLGRVGRELSPARGVAGLSVLCGFLCLNPLGAYLFAHKRAGLKGYATLAELATGTDPIFHLQALAAGHDERVSACLTKFQNVSSFPHAFALLIAAWLLIARLLRTRDLSDAGLAALAIAGCITLSPIAGITGGLALGLAAATILALSFRETWRHAHIGAFAAGGALLAGLIVAAPFVVLCGAGGGEGKSIGFDPTAQKLTSLLKNVGPVLLLALPAMIGALRRRTPASALLALSTLPLLFMAVVVWFPVDSEYKLTRMVAPLLGVFAAIGLTERLAHRSNAVRILVPAAILALFLPTNALAWRAYFAHSRASLPFHAEGIDIVMDADAHPAAEMYAWIRANTPPDAVIIDNATMKQRHFAGPLQGDELPVLARRPIFTDIEYYMTDYEKDFPARDRLVQKIFQGVAWDADDIARLRALSRPIYLLIRAYDRGAAPALTLAAADTRLQQVAKTSGAFLFELRRGGGDR